MFLIYKKAVYINITALLVLGSMT